MTVLDMEESAKVLRFIDAADELFLHARDHIAGCADTDCRVCAETRQILDEFQEARAALGKRTK